VGKEVVWNNSGGIGRKERSIGERDRGMTTMVEKVECTLALQLEGAAAITKKA
jgi:hypothetical protein